MSPRKVSLPPPQVDVLANGSSSCSDTLTGLPVPFTLYGYSPSSGSFVLTPTTKMAEWITGWVGELAGWSGVQCSWELKGQGRAGSAGQEETRAAGEWKGQLGRCSSRLPSRAWRVVASSVPGEGG